MEDHAALDRNMEPVISKGEDQKIFCSSCEW